MEPNHDIFFNLTKDNDVFTMHFDLNHTQSHYYLPTYNNLLAEPEDEEDADQIIGVSTIMYTQAVVSMMSYLDGTMIHDRSRVTTIRPLLSMHFYPITVSMEASWVVGDIAYDLSFSNDMPANARAIPSHPHRLVLRHLDWDRNGNYNFFLLIFCM